MSDRSLISTFTINVTIEIYLVRMLYIRSAERHLAGLAIPVGKVYI
jgi:hypothetical protein